jgi:CDP-glucose 4,6-dehydratase
MQAPQGWRPAESSEPQPKEARHLALDPALAASALGWRPRLASKEAMRWTADWYRAFNEGADARRLCVDQIARYEALA